MLANKGVMLAVAIIATLLVLTGLFFGGYHFGKQAESERQAQNFIAAMNDMIANQNKLNAQVAEQHQKDIADAVANAVSQKEGHGIANETAEKLIADLKRDNSRLSIEVANATSSAATGHPGNSNGSSTTSRAQLSQRSGEFLIRQAQRADKLAVDHNTCLKDYRLVKNSFEVYKETIERYNEFK